MGEPIGQRSMRLHQDNRSRGVSPRDVCARVSQGNLMLSPPTCRKPVMGEPINRRWMWPGQEDRCRGGPGVDLASLSSTQSGEPDAGCQLSLRVDHGGPHRSTLDATEPEEPVSGWSWRRIYRSPPGFAWSNTQSGEPDAGCLLPPRVYHGGTH